jgi:hypothetical protein
MDRIDEHGNDNDDNPDNPHRHQDRNHNNAATTDGKPKTIRFNVGGHIFQVTKSLLDLHSNTMLAKIASEQWLQQRKDELLTPSVPLSPKLTSSHLESQSSCSKSEIFIDRDGMIFRHVLSYLRDGQVMLPIAIDKNAILHELTYYGVTGVDPSHIQVSIQACAQGAIQINKLITSLEKEEMSIRFARLCIVKFRDKNCGGAKFQFAIRGNENGVLCGDKGANFYSSAEVVERGGEDMAERCNKHLGQFGLHLKSIQCMDVYRQGSKYTVSLEVL